MAAPGRSKAVELVRNGIVEQIKLPAKITVSTSGWFLVRVIADVPGTFRFASTAPWYIEVQNRPNPAGRDSAQFFIDWCRERIATLETRSQLNAGQKEQVLAPWRAANKFWESKRSPIDRPN